MGKGVLSRKKVFYELKDNFAFRLAMANYEFAKRYVSNKLVLDAGCGARRGAWALAKTARKVVGIDYSSKAIEYARRRFSRDNIEYKVMNCCELDFPDNTFDVAVSLEVIEHIEDQRRYLSQMSRVLKPGGIYIGSTPQKRLTQLQRGQIVNPYHIKELSLQEYRQLLSSYFAAVDIYGQALKVDVVGKFEHMKRFAAKMDVLGFRYLVPIKISDWFLGRVQSKVAPLTGGVSRDKITEADFEISKSNIKKNIHLIAVCRKG